MSAKVFRSTSRKSESPRRHRALIDGQLMAVPICLDSKRQTVDVGTPAALFRPRPAVSGGTAVNRQQYTVSPDGQHSLINTLTEDATVSPVTLVLNWKPRLEQ
jgi:hypothetical protein